MTIVKLVSGQCLKAEDTISDSESNHPYHSSNCYPEPLSRENKAMSRIDCGWDRNDGLYRGFIGDRTDDQDHLSLSLRQEGGVLQLFHRGKVA